MATAFLRDLPSRDAANFSVAATTKEDALPVQRDVPVKEEEGKIATDRKPLLLRYLEKNYKDELNLVEEKPSGSRGTKRAKPPNTHHHYKSRRMADP